MAYSNPKHKFHDKSIEI